MRIINDGSASTACRGATLADSNFTLTASPTITVVSGGSTSSVNIDDTVFNRTTGATIDNGAQMAITPIAGVQLDIAYSSLDTNIATVSDTGVVTRVADGTVGILAAGQFLTRREDVEVSRTMGGTSDTATGFVTGSFARHCKDQVDTLLNPSKSQEMFTTANHASGVYVRNTDFFAAAVDLTAVSVYNSTSQNASRAATAVTAKHFIAAEHWNIGVGATVKWVTADNTVVSRTVTAKQRITADLMLETLDSELPASITPMKLLPANYRSHIGNPYGSYTNAYTTLYYTSHLPLLATNQFLQCHVYDMSSTNVSVGVHSANTHSTNVQWPAYEDWTGPIIAGDSGSPVFLIIDGDPVLWTTWWGAGGGMDFAKYLTEINSYLSPYSVTTVNLDSYDVYAGL